MYVDPDGRVVWFVPLILGLVGGIANVAMNAGNIDGIWDGLTTFFVGAAAAAGACFTGGQSMAAVVGYGMAAGTVMGVSNDIVAQTGQNFAGFNNIDWGRVTETGMYGAIAGGVGAGVGSWAANSQILVNGVSSPLARSVVAAPLASGSAHVATGTIAGVVNGKDLGEAFGGSFQSIGKSMGIAAVTAAATTSAVSLAEGVNPINNKNFYPRNDGVKGRATDFELRPGDRIDRYGSEDGRFFSPENTPLEMRSLHPKANLDYNLYEVKRPFTVKMGRTRGYYGKPGGGTQFKSSMTIDQLIKENYIVPITK